MHISGAFVQVQPFWEQRTAEDKDLAYPMDYYARDGGPWNSHWKPKSQEMKSVECNIFRLCDAEAIIIFPAIEHHVQAIFCELLHIMWLYALVLLMMKP